MKQWRNAVSRHGGWAGAALAAVAVSGHAASFECLIEPNQVAPDLKAHALRRAILWHAAMRCRRIQAFGGPAYAAARNLRAALSVDG